MRSIRLLTWGLAALACAAAPARADFDDLDAGLRDAAPKLLAYLQEKECANVGVLKFLVDRGDGKLADNVGPLNHGVAARLEVALLLALTGDRPGVIHDANEVAAKIRGGNHLTADGRKKLFRRPYPLAWGDPEKPVKADRFLTGTLVVAKDLKTTTVRIDAFGPDGGLDEKVVEFTVPTPPRVLVETGRDFLITPAMNADLFRGARGLKNSQVQKTVVEQALPYQPEVRRDNKPTTGPDPLPTLEKDGPVKLAVLINGKPVPVVDGAIPEPHDKDKIAFRLDCVGLPGDQDVAYGAVLKVNGESTIYRERFDAKDCFKWILKPGEQVLVDGFQETPTVRNEFVILSPEESQANEVNYGQHAGTIQLTVFRGRLRTDGTAPTPVPTNLDSKEEARLATAAISRGSVKFVDDDNAPQKARPQTLGELQEQLKGREKSASDGRGMVGAGAAGQRDVKKVTFEPDPPEAIMNLTVRYYKPKGK